MDFLSSGIDQLPRKYAIDPQVTRIIYLESPHIRASFNGPGVLFFSGREREITKSGRNWGVKDAQAVFYDSNEAGEILPFADTRFQSSEESKVLGFQFKHLDTNTLHPGASDPMALFQSSIQSSSGNRILNFWQSLVIHIISGLEENKIRSGDIFDLVAGELIGIISSPLEGIPPSGTAGMQTQDSPEDPYQNKERKGSEAPLPPIEQGESDESNAGFRERIMAIRNIMVHHLETEIDLHHLAADAGFSFTTFRRYWRRYLGTPPNEYITRARMDRARILLSETSKPVGVIAREVGIPDQLYFSRRFRKYHGMSPRMFREKQA